jgi:hypothetical protein
LHDRADVINVQMRVIERHFLEQAQDRAKRFPDRRGRVIVEYLLDQAVAIESRRRDRGVSVGSKVTVIHPRHERREQLTISHRPRRGSAHDGVGMGRMVPAEEMTTVAKGANDVGRAKSRHCADEAIEQARGETVTAFDVRESHASSSARCATASRWLAAPNAAATMISNS